MAELKTQAEIDFEEGRWTIPTALADCLVTRGRLSAFAVDFDHNRGPESGAVITLTLQRAADPERRKRVDALTNLDAQIEARLQDDPASGNYLAMLEQARDAQHDPARLAALQAVEDAEREVATVRTDTSPGMADRLISAQTKLAAARAELDRHNARVEVFTPLLAEQHATATSAIWTATRDAIRERVAELTAKRDAMLAAVIAAAGGGFEELINLTAALDHLARTMRTAPRMAASQRIGLAPSTK